MKKSTKGALAAAAAGSLLLGGAGSLAYWTDAETITGTSIASGHLKLDPGTCGDWLLEGVVYAGTEKLVPGDTLTRHCTYTVDMTADNLKAKLDVAVPALSGTLKDGLSTSATRFTVNAGAGIVPGTPTTIADNDAIAVDVAVDFPNVTGLTSNDYNNASGLSAALGAITVTASQVP